MRVDQTSHGLEVNTGSPFSRRDKHFIGFPCERVRARDQPRAHFSIAGKLSEEPLGVQVQRERDQNRKNDRAEARLRHETLRGAGHHRVKPPLNARRRLKQCQPVDFRSGLLALCRLLGFRRRQGVRSEGLITSLEGSAKCRSPGVG